MSTQSVSIHYRPIKVGFLINEGSCESLIKAAEISSILWGGIYNAVIPVSSDISFAQKLIEFFNVDVLFPIDSNEAINKIIEGDKFRSLPMSRDIFHEDWHSKKQEVAILDVLNIFDLLWEKEFKNLPTILRSRFTTFEWEDPSFEFFSVVNYGRFPTKMSLKHDYGSLYAKALKAVATNIHKGSYPDKNAARCISPVLTTATELSGYFGGADPYGIYFGDHTSFKDLSHFWNLRACGIRLEFIPEAYIAEYEQYTLGFLEEIDKIPNRHPDIPDSITFYIKNLDHRSKIEKTLSQYRGKKRPCFSLLSDEELYEPSIFYFDWQTAMSSLDKPYDKLQLSISLPEKKFLARSKRQRTQHIAINVQPIGEFGYKKHTLKIPYLRGFNEFYSREIAFDPWKARVGRDGLTILEDVKSEALQIYPPSFNSIVQELFKDLGFDRVIPSLPGKIAENVINQVGDLEGCRIFKIESVRSLLSNPDPISRKELQQTIRVDSTKHQNLTLVRGQNQSVPARKDVIDHLLDKKLISIGYNLRCSNCELYSWFSLRTVDEQWVCQYCDSTNYSATQVFQLSGNCFKANGLFKLEKKRQEGAIPVVLTLLLLERVVRDSGFIYTSALKLEPKKGQPGYEIDLCVIEQRPRDSSVSIAIGECKDNNEIDDNDIQNLKSIRDRLVGKSINCYLLFSKVGGFTPAEINRFKILHKERVPIILLTDDELDEPMYPYWKSQDPKLPEKSALSLDDLYKNSVYLYLQ